MHVHVEQKGHCCGAAQRRPVHHRQPQERRAGRQGEVEEAAAQESEQIGGQIFIDSWGWVNPGNPARAAQMSAMAASVAHDGDGLNGARFCAAAIAQAFVQADQHKAQGWNLLHPFDSPYQMAGAGTIGLELVEDLPE